MTTIIRNRGGTKEHTAEISSLTIPDLWHIAGFVEKEAVRLGNRELERQAKAILECWHLAHDLKRHIELAEYRSGRSCRNCGAEFQPKTRGQDCCSSACRVQLRTFDCDTSTTDDAGVEDLAFLDSEQHVDNAPVYGADHRPENDDPGPYQK